MSGSIFLGNIHHAYAQTDGTYAFPNSREGDMLKQAVRELAAMRKERDEARRMWCEAAPVGNSLSVNDMDRRARAEATRRGWDCYKENTDYLQDLG